MRKVFILTMSSLGMFLAVGCASQHEAIPPSASLMAENQGRVDFTAPSDGHVYLEDRSANKLVYSGKLNHGERLTVEPNKDRVMVDGRTVQDMKIRDLNTLRVFFRPEPQADVAGSRTVQTRTVDTQRDVNSSPSNRSEIIVEPRSGSDTDAVRVRTSGDAAHKVTVQPGEEGSKVTVQPSQDGSKVTVQPGDEGSKVTVQPEKPDNR
jgi:hypothetical protein